MINDSDRQPTVSKWLCECMKCGHLITKTNMRTGKKTYACDNGTDVITCYDVFRYVGENGVLVPEGNGETMCGSFVERFIISSNQEEKT